MVTFVSLFSSAGVGCFGLKKLGFKCIATNELLEKRLNIQRLNDKCSDMDGYIQGSITDLAIQNKIIKLVLQSKDKYGDLDIVFATPPCQGMSVANHKKNERDNERNSLVVESVKIVEELEPKAFVFENVRSFLKTECFDDGKTKSINDMIDSRLADKYMIHKKIINFKNYGVNSSRTRTIVIGTLKKIEVLNPVLMFPLPKKSKSLVDVIGHLPSLKEMGATSQHDPLHSFRKYDRRMHSWIRATAPMSSAFDNDQPELRPHRLVNGLMIQNKNLNADKYKRQAWDKVAPCIHTRNDILSSQNTVHPEDDRVFSIRELMLMMNIPEDFRWFKNSLTSINDMSDLEKKKLLFEYDLVIRHSIGEAVPTKIFSLIGGAYLKLLKDHEVFDNWNSDNADILKQKVLKFQPRIFIDKEHTLAREFILRFFSEEIIQEKLQLTTYDECNMILMENNDIKLDMRLGKFSFVSKHEQIKIAF